MACRLTTDARSVHRGTELVWAPWGVDLIGWGEAVMGPEEREEGVVWEEFPRPRRRGGWGQDRGEGRCQCQSRGEAEME